MTDFYKATGDSAGHTLYAETDESIYCQITHPSGKVGDVQELSDNWPIERVTGQLGAVAIEPDEIVGLFSVKGQILDTLEQAENELSTQEVHDSIDEDSKQTTYGALKHLSWDGVIERHGPYTWSDN
jgi:hypothetical protein